MKVCKYERKLRKHAATRTRRNKIPVQTRKFNPMFTIVTFKIFRRLRNSNGNTRAVGNCVCASGATARLTARINRSSPNSSANRRKHPVVKTKSPISSGLSTKILSEVFEIGSDMKSTAEPSKARPTLKPPSSCNLIAIKKRTAIFTP